VVAPVGAALDYCYFVERGMAACILRLANGFEGASAMIGPEGLIGLHAMAEVGLAAPHETVVQVPVLAQRVSAALLREALGQNSQLLSSVFRFNEALRLQLAQSTVCNLHHNLPQRLARWLLMAFDRINSDELPLTQEALSGMLGAGRASVAHAAGILRDAGAVSYQYGRISLRDREILEDTSCECYAIVRKHYQRYLN
jgi:CRP-like cAMP-binding protein